MHRPKNDKEFWKKGKIVPEKNENSAKISEASIEIDDDGDVRLGK